MTPQQPAFLDPTTVTLPPQGNNLSLAQLLNRLLTLPAKTNRLQNAGKRSPGGNIVVGEVVSLTRPSGERTDAGGRCGRIVGPEARAPSTRGDGGGGGWHGGKGAGVGAGGESAGRTGGTERPLTPSPYFPKGRKSDTMLSLQGREI